MNTRDLNIKAWQEAQKELDSARCMFDYANNPYYIDIAIKLENAAKSKLDALKVLQEYEHITAYVKPTERQEKLNIFKKIIDWFVEPFEDIPIEKPINKMTWVDLRRSAGFTANPVENYNDIQATEERSIEHEIKNKA